MKDKPFNAHYRCAWCHGLKSKNDIIHVDETVPVCRHGDCKEQYYRRTNPGAVNTDRAQLRALSKLWSEKNYTPEQGEDK